MGVRPVVLDAAGTLLEVRGSVGEAYAEAAAANGVQLDPSVIEAGFARALEAAPPLAFGSLAPRLRAPAERAWWRRMAQAALSGAGPWPDDVPFDRFFDLAWDTFADPAVWTVPADVRPALRGLRRSGAPLAVFSNWDRRLEPLLHALGLAGYFARIIVSSDLPAAKPDPAAFTAARAALDLGDRPPVMIGDRHEHDVVPARAAGWDAIWLDRRGLGSVDDRRVTDLRELLDHPLLTTNVVA